MNSQKILIVSTMMHLFRLGISLKVLSR